MVKLEAPEYDKCDNSNRWYYKLICINVVLYYYGELKIESKKKCSHECHGDDDYIEKSYDGSPYGPANDEVFLLLTIYAPNLKYRRYCTM